MDEIKVTVPKGFGRFTKHIVLGSVFSGVLSAIPILNYLNCLFCLLNMAGVVFALWLYLNANSRDMITNSESVKFGAFAGAGAGLILGLISALIIAVLGGLGGLGALADSMGGAQTGEAIAELAGFGLGVGCVIFLIVPVLIILYSAFGALGAFLGMQFFFKTRIRKT